MVQTGNECQHTDYVSSRGKNCCGSLLRGSVVPAKVLLVLLKSLVLRFKLLEKLSRDRHTEFV